MGKFPVISITLKRVEAKNYTMAKNMLASVIGGEALRFSFLTDSERLSEKEKEQYNSLVTIGKGEEPGFLMSEEIVTESLLILSILLYQHYGQKTVLLIDEYDVPLEKAHQSGYYEEMVVLIRGLPVRERDVGRKRDEVKRKI